VLVIRNEIFLRFFPEALNSVLKKKIIGIFATLHPHEVGNTA
jgi:hypothetical protein